MKHLVLLLGLLLTACPNGLVSQTFTMPLGVVCNPVADCTPPLEVPANVGGSETLKVRMSVVTSSGCQGFERFDIKREAAKLEITPVGRELLNAPCTLQAGSQWVEYTDAPTMPRSSPFVVIVRQPTGPDFTREVTIK